MASKNTSLLLKAYNNQNGLLETQMKTSVESIDPEKTVVIPLSLTLPKKGGYNLQLDLYENGVKKTELISQYLKFGELGGRCQGYWNRD